MAFIPFGQILRGLAFWASLFALAVFVPFGALLAAPQASHVMDARTGETLFESNANTQLHPASLTKMLTLYIAFEEIQRGNLSLDSMITVSKNAAAQPPSRLGLKAGQKIQLRFLIRAAAIKSANDAAQAIGDAIGGNQADFAKRMTRTAKSLGMHNSTFKNASGLTAKGHLSTAADMSILGRRLFYDFPQYYNIFSRRQTSAGVADVANTNRRFLDAYKGADGIKTGFTQAAGFNLTASAERGNVRIIATVFGGESTADRNAKVAKLLDRGFAEARSNVGVVPPPPRVYDNADNELLANAVTADGLPEGGAGSSAKTVRAVMTVRSSPYPMPRPNFSEMASVAEDLVAEMAGGIAGALAEATGVAVTDVAGLQSTGADQPPQALPFALVDAQDGVAVQNASQTAASIPRPAPRPTFSVQNVGLENAGSATAAAGLNAVAAAPADLSTPQLASAAPQDALPVAPPQDVPSPVMAAANLDLPQQPQRSAPIYDDSALLAMATPDGGLPAAPAPQGEVVSRLSTSGGAHFGVNVGRFKSSDAAERVLVKTQLVESAVLGESLRKVTAKGGGYDANFLGLTQEGAALACRRLTARAIPCITLGP